MDVKQNVTPYSISWDHFRRNIPVAVLKFGVKTRTVKLHRTESGKRRLLSFEDAEPDGKYLSLTGRWDNIDPSDPSSGSILSLRIKNEHSSSLRVSRVSFRIENGLDEFLKRTRNRDISFLRNGFQSWSESRSYRVTEKPLHSWLPVASLMSDNLSNLPSDNYGSFCSEMFTVIADTSSGESILIGQMGEFNQFVYLNAMLKRNRREKRNLAVVFDLGRKLLAKGEELDLDRLFFMKGNSFEVQKRYFSLLKTDAGVTTPQKNSKGWCTWYCYSNALVPDDIHANLSLLESNGLSLDYFQIDDGYEKKTGDWLLLKESFQGRMREISDRIRDVGYRPAIWIAPFIADRCSELVRNYPEFVLKTEKGKVVNAGFNPIWSGIVFRSLDITNTLFQEYLQEVIHTYTHDWGFDLLKLDFLYAGCDETGFNQNLRLSRSELIKFGMGLIKGAAKKDTVLLGCGMPLASGVGNVDFMRVGIDTAPYWNSAAGYILGNPGEMIGAKNSLRNTIVRSYMNKKLWVNDPECFMVRKKNTCLTPHQIDSDINGKLLAGGLVMFSDDISKLDAAELARMKEIAALSDAMYAGEAIPLDVMERAIPQILYNTAGYIGLFNFNSRHRTVSYDLGKYRGIISGVHTLRDVWNGEEVIVQEGGCITLEGMPPHSSRLFRVEN